MIHDQLFQLHSLLVKLDRNMQSAIFRSGDLLAYKNARMDVKGGIRG